MKTEFLFHRVIVVADGPNVFSEQLEKRQILFTTMETIPGYADPPDLIVAVNKGLRAAESLKGRFPCAQVVRCQGGHKNFAPRIKIIYGDDDHDVHWFSSWDQFVGLISCIQPRQTRIFTHDGGPYYLRSVQTPPCPDTRTELNQVFTTMLRVSEAYLSWYLQWLKDVGEMFFDCSFRVSKNRRAVRRLTLENDGRFVHRGLLIFQEEVSVSFFGFDKKEYFATVISVSDEEIVVSFTTPLTRSEAQGLMSFTRNVDEDIPRIQRDLCWKALSRDSADPCPLSVMAGDTVNHDDDDEHWLADLELSGENARRIRQDESQAVALATVTDRRWVSLIHGPAGTGKTFLTSLAIRQFHSQARVILLVSHSNQGLDNLLAFVAQSVGNPGAIYRLGNNARNISKSAEQFHRTARYGGSMSGQRLSTEEASDITTTLMYGKNVILACTMTSFLIDHTMDILRQKGFRADVVIIDEASRGLFFEVLPVIETASGRIIFVGDPDQLGNIGISPDAKQYLNEGGFSREDIDRFTDGWFTTVIREGLLPVDLLRINRRSLPAISELVSRLFYGGRLISGRFDPENPGRFEFLDTSAAQDAHDEQVGTSWINRREANLVVRQIVKLLAQGVKPEDIGVITPYRGQIALIRQKLRGELVFHPALKSVRLGLPGGMSIDFSNQPTDGVQSPVTEDSKMTPILQALGRRIDTLLQSLVNTVDAFQGSQRKVIILSMVRSNDEGAIGFNSNVSRLRVAFSRAEDRLIVIGSSRTFLSSDVPEVRSIFRQSVEYARQLESYREIE